MLIWTVRLELMLVLELPAQTQILGRVNRWMLNPSVFKHEDPAAEWINMTSLPRLPLLAWQRDTLLIREFTQSQASPSNCYPQWQTTPFSLSVGLQFTLPPRWLPLLPILPGATLHLWPVNRDSPDASAPRQPPFQTQCTYTNDTWMTHLFMRLLWRCVWVPVTEGEKASESARQRITRPRKNTVCARRQAKERQRQRKSELQYVVILCPEWTAPTKGSHSI